jgi:hypothetical protein
LKTFFAFILLFISFLSYGQSDLKRVPVSSLPEDIQNVLDISVAMRWTDTLGDNVLVITKKIIKRDDEDRAAYDSRNKYGVTVKASKQTIPSKAYHFLVINDSAIQTWTAVTISKMCIGEDGNHTKTWSIVTDLNKNAIAEVWIISKSECIDDPDGGTMEIVMYQGMYRCIMKGPILSNSTSENNLDNNFRNGPEVLRKYALKLWQQFILKS